MQASYQQGIELWSLRFDLHNCPSN